MRDAGRYHHKRRAFLNEAGLLLTERGVESFSLARLAARLNITPAALYYYFKSKQDVLFECYALSFDLADVALERAHAAGGDSCRRLERFIHDYMLAALRELQPTMSLRETTMLQPAYSNRIRQRRNRLHKRLRDLVRQGIAEGSVAPCDPALTIIAIIGAVSDLLRVYDPKGKMSSEDIASQLSRQLGRGFSARPASARSRLRNRLAVRSGQPATTRHSHMKDH
jgi:TetR/AcrR family transcriptional regulator